MRAYKIFKFFDKLITTVFTITMFAFLAVAIITVFGNNTGEKTGIMGYQPMYVLSGSMEPTMKIKSVAILKELEPTEEIEVGDIITFTKEIKSLDDTGNARVTITHRVLDIKGERIFTKGDNNHSPDLGYITRADVKGKIVYRFNFVADFFNMLKTKNGKITVGLFAGFLILLYISIGSFKAYLDEKYGDEVGVIYVEKKVLKK